MDTALLERKFTRMGARLKLARREPPPFRPTPAGVTVDVQSDREGEFFEISRLVGSAADVEVIDVRPRDRHLLLLVREAGDKSKFLCGHDERHWFVAAIPESAPVGTVRQAKEALKPPEVRAAQSRVRLGAAAGERRRNAAYVRQGEWFFVPAPGFTVDPKHVRRNEPLRRGRGKPHTAELCCRVGGETVYVCTRHPNGVTEAEYRKIISLNAKAPTWGWSLMVRNAGVHVRGRVRHADHKTIVLHGWHRVLLNTETQARAMQNVAFLD